MAGIGVVTDIGAAELCCPMTAMSAMTRDHGDLLIS